MASATPPHWYMSTSPGNQATDRLTFGVEIEIVIPCLLPQDVDPDPKDDRSPYGIMDYGPIDKSSEYRQYRSTYSNARKHVANTLSSASIPAEASLFDGAVFTPENPRAWGVQDEDDVYPPDNTNKDYAWYAIELISPPLYFSQEAIQEVLFVISLLTNKYRLCVTERTDLHVHVGNGQKGFTAETIQNLAATYWTFEAQIEQIHPPWMIDNVIALSFNRSSTLAKRNFLEPEHRNKSWGLDWLLRSENCNIASLHRAAIIFEPPEDPNDPDYHFHTDRGALNLAGVSEITNKKTVEFRQHTCTLDKVAVARWICVCVGLLEFASTVEKGTLEPFLEEHIGHSPDDFSLDDVLKALGMPREAEYYGRIVAEKGPHWGHPYTQPSKRDP